MSRMKIFYSYTLHGVSETMLLNILLNFLVFLSVFHYLVLQIVCIYMDNTLVLFTLVLFCQRNSDQSHLSKKLVLARSPGEESFDLSKQNVSSHTAIKSVKDSQAC